MALPGIEKGTRPAEAVIVAGIESSRSDFGAGSAGDSAWQIIQNGALCEATLETGVCGLPAVGTTDFDVLGDLTQVPHCSEEHHGRITTGVQATLDKAGRNTVFGKNGHGRGISDQARSLSAD